MNVAVLTGEGNSPYAGALVSELLAEGHRISAIVVVRRSRVRQLRLSLAQTGLRGVLDKALNKLAPTLGGRGPAEAAPAAWVGLHDVLRRHSIPRLSVGNIHDDRSLRLLRESRPDVIVYAGGGILREPVISVPAIGVLNAHMGLLPDYRGMNVLEWSLLEGAPVGVTVHFIDTGIDTGDILLWKELEPVAGDTLETLRDKATRASVSTLVEATRHLEEGTARRRRQESGNPQYFVMHARLRREAQRRLERRLDAGR